VRALAADDRATVTGGPDSITLTGTTDDNGVANFTDVPAGTPGYTVKGVLGSSTVQQTGVLISANSTTNVTLGVSRPGFRSEPVEMKISDTGEAWEGKGGSVNEKDVTLKLSYDFEGKQHTSDAPFKAAAGKK